MTHELAHMNTYNEGFLGEETTLHTRKQVGSENKNKKMSEKERAEYLAKIENRYKSKDINKMYEEANLVDESAKEYYISPEDIAYRKKYQNLEREYHLPTGERATILKEGLLQTGEGITFGVASIYTGGIVGSIGGTTSISNTFEGLGKVGTAFFGKDKDLGIAVNPVKNIADPLTKDGTYEVADSFIKIGTMIGFQNTSEKFLSNSTSKPETIRVGRWMSENEYKKMLETGKVQMSKSNITHVANPADINAFKGATKGSFYVEFDIKTNAILQGGNDKWGIIPGPGSLYDRLNQKKGIPNITEMPDALNIEMKGIK